MRKSAIECYAEPVESSVYFQTLSPELPTEFYLLPYLTLWLLYDYLMLYVSSYLSHRV